MRHPVWHDDAQGTGSVTLAGLINALRVVDKEIGKIRIVMNGAGASNTTIARLLLLAAPTGEDGPVRHEGFAPQGARRREGRPGFLPEVELCEKTNPGRWSIEEACKAPTRSSRSASRPDTISGVDQVDGSSRLSSPAPTRCRRSTRTRPGGRRLHRGHRRGDFPNQVNTRSASGHPEGALLVRARKITDEMAIAARPRWPTSR